MQKYFDYVINSEGQPITGVSVAAVNESTGSTTIYSDDGVTTKTNPVTTDSNGYFEFYAANGKYTLTISGTGVTTQVLSGVVLYDADDVDAILESEVDTDIKTLSLPASTTISTLGASLIADTTTVAARETLEADYPITEDTGTTYNFTLPDAFTTVRMTNASAISAVVPANASIAFPVGTEIYIIQGGAGAITISISSDTLNVNANLTLVTNGQHSVTGLKKTAATEWVAFGNLVAA